MGYRVYPDGSIEVETVEEALAVRELLRSKAAFCRCSEMGYGDSRAHVRGLWAGARTGRHGSDVGASYTDIGRLTRARDERLGEGHGESRIQRRVDGPEAPSRAHWWRAVGPDPVPPHGR